MKLLPVEFGPLARFSPRKFGLADAPAAAVPCWKIDCMSAASCNTLPTMSLQIELMLLPLTVVTFPLGRVMAPLVHGDAVPQKRPTGRRPGRSNRMLLNTAFS